jgi:hypothetical protein
MKQTNRITLTALLMALALSIGVVGQNERTLLLIVNGTGNAWPDCGLRERLVSSLCDRSGLLLASPERSESLVRRLAGRFDKQAVLAEGQSEKYRYILWCDIVKQQLTIENGFSLPILFTQKRVKASLELEYHIIDCSRGRSVAADRIVANGNGPATLQCIDFCCRTRTKSPCLTTSKKTRRRSSSPLLTKLLGSVSAEEIASVKVLVG